MRPDCATSTIERSADGAALDRTTDSLPATGDGAALDDTTDSLCAAGDGAALVDTIDIVCHTGDGAALDHTIDDVCAAGDGAALDSTIDNVCAAGDGASLERATDSYPAAGDGAAVDRTTDGQYVATIEDASNRGSDARLSHGACSLPDPSYRTDTSINKSTGSADHHTGGSQASFVVPGGSDKEGSASSSRLPADPGSGSSRKRKHVGDIVIASDRTTPRLSPTDTGHCISGNRSKRLRRRHSTARSTASVASIRPRSSLSPEPREAIDELEVSPSVSVCSSRTCWLAGPRPATTSVHPLASGDGRAKHVGGGA